MKWTYSESFAGIGAWSKSIKRVTQRHDDECELKWFAEFDKYAINSFCAIHDEPESKNIVDITKPADVEEVDVFFYSPPCQTFSIAGNREGTDIDKGNLFYNALEKLKQANPKYAIMENVKGLVTGDTKEDFYNMLWSLEDAGYFNYWEVLNSKDYGIPQNRERVFVVSIREDLYEEGKRFEFPKKIELEKTFYQFLENEVEEKYKLPKEFLNKINLQRHINDINFDPYKVNQIGNIIETDSFGGNPQSGRVYGDGLSPTLNTMQGGGLEPKIYQKPRGENKGGFKDECPTISSNSFQENNILFKDGIIRKITPLECFRLQGFDDEDYYSARKGYDEEFGTSADGTTRSDSQMYKRAGNSITVNVIEEILENLLYDRKQEWQQIGMF